MKTTEKPTETDETPIAPHIPRRDRKRFDQEETENFMFEHQHTKGWGPISTCMVVNQYEDGYCKVITGPGVNGRPVTATAWSGCLTKSKKMDHRDKSVFEGYLSNPDHSMTCSSYDPALP